MTKRENQNVDIAIIGGGISGLAAAKEAAARGARVAVFEGDNQFGGRFRHQSRWVNILGKLERISDFVSELANNLEPTVAVFRETTVIGVDDDKRVTYVTKSGIGVVEAGAILVATGGRQQELLFPGWWRPGVILGDAAGQLIVDGVLPGMRPVVIGLTQDSLWVARELAMAGAEKVMIVGAEHPFESLPAVTNAVSRLHALISARNADDQSPMATDGDLRSISEIPPNVIEVHPEWTIHSAAGNPQVSSIEVLDESSGQIVSLDCDVLVLSHFRSPVPEILQLAGAQFLYSLPLGGWVPLQSPSFETTVPGIFVAGSTAGMDSVAADYLTGRLAAASACRSLQMVLQDNERQTSELWQELQKVSMQDQLRAREQILFTASTTPQTSGNGWSREGLPEGNSSAPVFGHTKRTVDAWSVVCRCEDINVQDIEMCIEQGARTPDDIKRMTRCGMGTCQWRDCRTLVSEELSRQLKVAIDHVPLPNVRFPVYPVSLQHLLSHVEQDGVVRSVLSEVDDHE
ncbi:(2Fe-2S)-binding protein [Alicyclobacillus tolerans]|uniref:(2Fe-2S)-binding protein n=1 Tax=Alicyclobacillus tolerans TaxID=90970 RepID=UPI001F44832C|nr:(2Fe-2S)-binding protein [Alicyclobacillus tolerans]MCF8567963.1 (2Fe-2S)-binding protein [Alicyclobacillus tolerans]